jgi:hypothetical protein
VPDRKSDFPTAPSFLPVFHRQPEPLFSENMPLPDRSFGLRALFANIQALRCPGVLFFTFVCYR